jgi:hypothetical protein
VLRLVEQGTNNMPLRALDPDEPNPIGEPCEVLEVCPVCGGKMEVVYSRTQSKVCVCVDCHSGVTVPASAWQVVKTKREAKSSG